MGLGSEADSVAGWGGHLCTGTHTWMGLFDSLLLVSFTLWGQTHTLHLSALNTAGSPQLPHLHSCIVPVIQLHHPYRA